MYIHMYNFYGHSLKIDKLLFLLIYKLFDLILLSSVNLHTISR